MGRVTIRQVAAEVGLSVCTVNKALTGKPRISESTRQRVVLAAQRMGYHPNKLAQALARRPLTISVLYPEVWPAYYRFLVDGVRQGIQALQEHNLYAQYREMDNAFFDETAEQTIQSYVEGVDAVILCTSGTLRENTIWQTLSKLQIPYILLGNDIVDSSRLASIRLDAQRCGRVAAELLGMMTAGGSLAILVGNKDIRDHHDKITGFVEEATRLGQSVVRVCETQDDPAIAYPVTRRLFLDNPDITGIYIATDNAEGVCRFLCEQTQANPVKVVATGVFPELCAYIERGVVQCTLFQNMALQGQLAVQTLYRYLTERVVAQREIFVQPVVITRNLVSVGGK